jgi:hypothetical protein
MIKLLNLLTPDNSNERYLRAKLTVTITVLINFQQLIKNIKRSWKKNFKCGLPIWSQKNFETKRIMMKYVNIQQTSIYEPQL